MTTIARPLAHVAPLDLSICRAEVGAGYLWVQYRITPVSEEVRERPRVRDLTAGVAEVRGRRLEHCRVSYRLGLDCMHVDGVLAVGPDFDAVQGTVRVAFTPLPGVPGAEDDVCELEVEVSLGTVVRVAVRAV